MKKAIIFLIVVLFAVGVIAFNEPNRIRGIAWNAHINASGQMEYQFSDESYPELWWYTKVDEKLVSEGVELKSVLYGFYLDRFCAVIIVSKGPASFDNIIGHMKRNYGEPVQPNQFMPRKLEWNGKNVKIFTSYNQFSKEGKIHYAYYPTIKKMERDKKAQMSNTSNDDF